MTKIINIVCSAGNSSFTGNYLIWREMDKITFDEKENRRRIYEPIHGFIKSNRTICKRLWKLLPIFGMDWM